MDIELRNYIVGQDLGPKNIGANYGEEHYMETTLFRITLSEQQKIDKAKTQLAKKHGFKIARIPYWLDDNEVQLEVNNILLGEPSYPEIPDLKQSKSKPSPK